MKKRQMQKWILVLAAIVFVCFIFYKVDFFHAEITNILENESLNFSGEEYESKEYESEEDEEDTKETLELQDYESQDNELNLAVESNDPAMNNENLMCDVNCNCENGNCDHNCRICEVRKLIDSLPAKETIDIENYEELYEKVQNIYEEYYCKLTDDEKENLDLLLGYKSGEKFEELFNFFYENMSKPVASVTNENGDIKFYYDIFKAWAAAKSENSATVTLMKDENLEAYDEEHRCLYVEDGNNITLELADNVTLSGQHGNGVICVKGGTFILNGGNSSVVNEYDPVGAILVENGTFILKSGNVIGKGDTSKPNFVDSISCGVQIRNGNVYIEGGEIKGDGVGTTDDDIVGLYVQGGTVNISGGYIAGKSNSALSGEGIYVKANNTISTVNISGGKIEGSGSGTDTSGYGVRMRSNSSATVNISGGIIIGKSDNKSGRGIYVTTNVVANISGGTIVGYSENDYGGGVHVYSKTSEAFIYGGVIIGSGNNESYGVSSTGYVEINGGIITGSGSETGCGVRVVEGGEAIISGGDVTGKGRTTGYGVYVSDNESYAIIKSGIITGRSTISGCGIGVLNSGTADIYNGEIAGSGISSYGVNVSGEDSVVHINSGLIGENNTYHYVIYDDSNEAVTIQKESITYTDTELAYGVKVSENAEVSINAGEISGSGQKDGYGIYISENGVASITGGNITGTGNSNNGYGIMVDGGTTTINGGEFIGKGGIDGYGIMADKNGLSVDISGGVFTGKGGSKDGYGMRVEGGMVQVIHGTSTPYGGMFIGDGNESENGYGLYVKGGEVALCTGVYKGSTHSVYTISPDKADSFTNLLEADHAYRYTNIPADEISSTTEGDSIAVPDSVVINDEWIYNDRLSESDFNKKSVTVMKIPLDIDRPTVERDKVDYGYSDKEAPVICIEAERLIRDESKEITYQWYDSEGRISGATEETYVPVGLSVGKHFFKCVVICDQYELESEEVEISVNEKYITATVTIKDKEYDGNAKADIDNIILSEDFVAGDDVYLAYEDDKIEDYRKIETSFVSADVGEYTLKSEDKDKFQLSGEDRNNYCLNTIVKTASIKPRELKLIVSVNDKVYDGSNYAEIDEDKTFLIHDDIADSDHISLDIKDIQDDKDYILKFSDKNVNEDIPVELNKEKFQLINNDKGNYSLILPDDVTADIMPVEVGLTVVVKDEEIGADKMKKSDSNAEIIFADFDREKLADCDTDIVELVDFSNINAAFESVELGKHTIRFDSEFYLIDLNSGMRTDNYILIPNVMASIYKKGASGIENPVPEDNITSTSAEESIKVTSVLSGLEKNPNTGFNDHLLYFIVVLVLFGGIILIIHITGKRKKEKTT